MLQAMSSMAKDQTAATEPKPANDATGPSAEQPPRAAPSLEGPPETSGQKDPTASLSLSQSELDLMVRESKVGAQRRTVRGPKGGDALMSVDRLAQELRKAGSAESGGRAV